MIDLSTTKTCPSLENITFYGKKDAVYFLTCFFHMRTSFNNNGVGTKLFITNDKY